MRFKRKAIFFPAVRVVKARCIRALILFVLLGAAIGGGCLLVSNEGEIYYGRVAVPVAEDFRWSNGGLPQQFDPALVAAAPDTDAVRALCEGLTDYDSRSLAVIPGVAERWESSDDNHVWTFFLRPNARWSNGDPVAAQDFVRSWRRAAALGDQAPHGKLLENISGLHSANIAADSSRQSVPDIKRDNAAPNANHQSPLAKTINSRKSKQGGVVVSFGVEAFGNDVLRVRLVRPDANFPALVAHPVFFPVHDESKTLALPDANKKSALPLITNGAFRLTAASIESVLLERAENYWDAPEVNLQRVRFVATANAESALAAYRAGSVDAVTNAGFEPLALKMLAPYKDFRRATYGALTFYRLNTTRPPFDDVRVRQALALAIDRERLSEDEMGSATEPAGRFLPVQLSGQHEAQDNSPAMLEHNIEQARQLLAEAGFSQGKDFPRVRLLVNRNDQQRQIAQAVAAMWQSALGIETEIIVKDWEAYEAALLAGDYDVARRGMVMQTPDEANNLRTMFEPELARPIAAAGANREAPSTSAVGEITTQAQALRELPAIPLYFASSYALIKPYVNGFDQNMLDAPSLKRVRIDTAWRMPQKSEASVSATDN